MEQEFWTRELKRIGKIWIFYIGREEEEGGIEESRAIWWDGKRGEGKEERRVAGLS